MNKKKITTLASFIALTSPLIAFAAGQTLADIIDIIIYYVNQALVLLMGIAVLMFVYYVIMYFVKPSDGEGRKAAASYVMWSLIGFFAILSFWGLVNVLQNTFGLQNSYNRPTSWADFSNLFPTGSSGPSGSSAGSFNGAGSMCGNVVIPASGNGYNYSCVNGQLQAVAQ